MLAGAIEFNSKHNLGRQLIELANSADGLAHIPYDHSDSWRNDKVTLVQQLFWNSPESRLVQGIACHQDSGARITAWARIDNRTELLSQLPEYLHPLAQTDPGLILAGYVFWQDNVCEKLLGDFSFAIYDPRTESLYCGRDHMGVRPFYYCWDGKDFVFSSSLAVLNKLNGINLRPSEEWLARYLHSCEADWQLTAYDSIKKLPPACFLKLERSCPKLIRYFSFSNVEESKDLSQQDYVASYRELLERVVNDRIRSDYAIATELSGGLDSSSIAALASQEGQGSGNRLEAFGLISGEMDADCILAVSAQSKIKMTHLVTLQSRWDTELAQNIFYKTNGVPEEHPDASASLPFYECARNAGIRTMLSGFGGDEFVTCHGSLALAQLYHQRDYLDFLHRHRGRWLKYLRAAKWITKSMLLNDASSHVSPMEKIAQQQWSRRLVTDQVAESTGLKSRMLPEHFADSTASYESLNDYLLEKRLSPHLSARTENFTLMAAAFGIEYRWPLLDVRLISHFLAAPVQEKFGPGGVTRYLHRRAVTGLIPDLIACKEKSMGNTIYPYDDSADRLENAVDLHPTLSSIIHSQRFTEMTKRLRESPDDAYSYLDQWGYDAVVSANKWLKFVDGI